jgi:hypothetical protein
VREVTVPSKAPVGLVSNRIVAEGEERFAVPLKDVTRLLKTSWISKVTGSEATPATTVRAVVMIPTFVAAAGVIVST